VHAPWYGYLFWTAVTAGGFGRDADSTFVAANVDRWENCTANIKVRAAVHMPVQAIGCCAVRDGGGRRVGLLAA
jgi:hypothetical protein